MLWVISNISKPKIEGEAIRPEVRRAHQDYIKSKSDIIFFAGPMQSDDGTEKVGSLWIINVNSRAEAKAFSDGEAYTQAGLFSSVTITRVRKSHFRPELAG